MVEPTAEQLQKMKTMEVEMLAVFIRLCEDLQLRYYLVGGTLLGAIRHEGFIPWDDDIDVAMPRADYEAFLRAGPRALPPHYFLQHCGSEPAYCMNYTKLRDSRTTVVEYTVRKYAIHHGVFMDIFPLDYYPEEPGAQKRMDLIQRLFKLRLRVAVEMPKEMQHSVPVDWGMRAIGTLTRLRYPDMHEAVLAREKLHRSVKPGKRWANYCGAWGKKEIMPVEWYGEGVKRRFEGLEATVPTHYDQWLTQVYGDYMQLPPVEKRVSPHYAEVIDLEQPYTVYNQKFRTKS